MKANKIGHVHLNVRNLEKAESFYADVFGFRVTERVRDTFVFLSLGDQHHDLAGHRLLDSLLLGSADREQLADLDRLVDAGDSHR